MHESNTPHSEVKRGSDRNFGLVFVGFFCLIAASMAWYGNNSYKYYLLVAFVLCIISIVSPNILRPLNILWFKFGMVLHQIISPIILGLLFFTVVTPTGLLMRIFGKRPLNLRFDSKLSTYWVIRNPPGPQSDSFKNQF
jgi:hypothetical protein